MNISSSDEIINIKNQSKIQKNKIKKYFTFLPLIGYILVVFFLFYILTNIKSLNYIIKASKNNERYNSNSGSDLKILDKNEINYYLNLFEYESNMPYLKDINKKRTFEKRYPLPKEINNI